MTSVKELKEQASSLYLAGDYSGAVEGFTAAIDAAEEAHQERKEGDDEGEEDVRHVLYSNRAATYSNLKQYEKAVEDANRCIALRSDWPKGFLRKGEALMHLGKGIEAYNAYQRGLQADSSNTKLKEGLARAQALISTASGDSSSSGSSSSSGFAWNQPRGASAAPASSGGSAVPPHATTAASFMDYARQDTTRTALFCLRVFLLLNALVYCIPLIVPAGLAQGCYRRAMLSVIAIYGIMLYKQFGVPKFNMQWWAPVLQDSTMQYLMLACVFAGFRPYLFAMGTLLIVEIYHIARSVAEIRNLVPAQVMATVDQQVATYMPKIMTNTDWNSASVSRKWALVAVKVQELSSTMQVMLGIFLIVELLTPSRNILGLVIYWQMMQMRYMADRTGYLQNAFRSVDVRIMALVNHQYCPRIVATGYGKLKGFLHQSVQPPQPGASASPRCVIS